MDERWDALVIRVPSSDGVLDVLASAGLRRPLIALASALAASPPASGMRNVVLGVRERPEPTLVFAGAIDPAARARIADLSGLLGEAAMRLRILTWAEIEAAVIELARQVRECVGADDVAASRIIGVPRGGHIVAGLLAYALDLPGDGIGATNGGPAIVVDDCLLSGVRLREFLRTSGDDRIIVATICSHPDARRAVERDDRVLACVAGFDLEDHTAALLGDAAASWRERWSQRVPERYHTAVLDLPVFPWSEPQVRLWNDVTERIEAHWWLGPPEVCLRNRVAPPVMTVQVADDQPGLWRLAPGVVPITQHDAVVLVDTTHGRSVRLAGIGAQLWQAWMAEGAGGAAAVVARRHDRPVTSVAADVDRMVTLLAEAQLLSARAQ